MNFDPCDPKRRLDSKFDSLPRDLRAQKAVSIENSQCLRSLAFVRRSVCLSVARSSLHYDRINRAQFDAILAEELAARTPSFSPSKSSEKERQTKRRRLLFLGYLLTHDADAAKILAYTEPPPPSPITTASKDDASMADIPSL